MNYLKTILLVLISLAPAIQADELQRRKVYECRYMQNPPYGVDAWAQSEMVQTGQRKENRFVPYNSAAAKQLILDATTLRDVSAAPELQDHETSFYMVYDQAGWYIYIHSQEPEIADFVDAGKNIGLELFFSPGMHAVPYYQMMVNQHQGRLTHYDWGMPHRHYRSLKGSVKVESRALETGYATFLFVPWERLYDRLPLNGDHWRFSLMRWGPSVTWGGQVHDTGNFGLIHFQQPDARQREEIELNILRSARSKFYETAGQAVKLWSDAEVGDLDFFNQELKPLIDRNTALADSLGKPAEWNAETLQTAQEAIPLWMEFQYEISERRSQYLLDKHFQGEP